MQALLFSDVKVFPEKLVGIHHTFLGKNAEQRQFFLELNKRSLRPTFVWLLWDKAKVIWRTNTTNKNKKKIRKYTTAPN